MSETTATAAPQASTPTATQDPAQVKASGEPAKTEAPISGESSSTKEAPPAPRKFKAKVNGRELELDESEVIQSGLTAAQMRRAASEQFEQAKAQRAEAEALRQRFAKDPVAVFEEMNPGQFRQIAEQYLIRQLQVEQMDPTQRALLQHQQALEAERAKVAKYEADQKSAAEEAQAAQYRQQFDSEFSAALNECGLPKTAETVRRMAQLTGKALQMGLQLTSKDIASLVKQDFLEEQVKTLSGLDGEPLLAALGEGLLKKIRTADVAKIKAAKAVATQAPAIPSKPEPARRERHEPNPHLRTRDQLIRAGILDAKDFW